MVPNIWVKADDILIEGKEAMAFAFRFTQVKRRR
ncbi:MAG: hypothetical protein CM15mP23_12280 [Cryomorphaceae bacterium]|nr:MAG: hypothetical protein CM15mP23_12280 [Cryomorphaceae bacterium]